MSENLLSYYCIRFKDLTSNPEFVPELLCANELPFSSWVDFETGESYHTLYYLDQAERDRAIPEMKKQMDIWKAAGATLDDLTLLDLPPEDWAESWKRFFTIQHVEPGLVVKPTWLKYEKQADEVVIEIDPGMSFGTGRHATTTFCLRALTRLRKKIPLNCKVIDAGTGSGILAIAAYQLGYDPVEAFDNDPVCITCSQENAELNGVAGKIFFYQSDLTQLESSGRQFGLVIANILAPVLIAEKKRLVNLVKPKHYLVLAGILTSEYEKLKQHFVAEGMEECWSETEAEWTGGVFFKPEK